MFPSTMAPKRPILVSQWEIDHQKSTILLIFSTLSLGGCGGHPMRPELNLKDKIQMSTTNEYTDNFKSNLICIFPSVRAISKKPLCPRTQCIYDDQRASKIKACEVKKKWINILMGSFDQNVQYYLLLTNEMHIQKDVQNRIGRYIKEGI